MIDDDRSAQRIKRLFKRLKKSRRDALPEQRHDAHEARLGRVQTLRGLDGLVKSRRHAAERLVKLPGVVHHAGPERADHRRRHLEQLAESLSAPLVHLREFHAQFVDEARRILEIAVFVARADADQAPRLDACADAGSGLRGRLTHALEGAVHLGCIDAGEVGRIGEASHAGRRRADSRGAVGERVHLGGRADDRTKCPFDGRDAGQTGHHALERVSYRVSGIVELAALGRRLAAGIADVAELFAGLVGRRGEVFSLLLRLVQALAKPVDAFLRRVTLFFEAGRARFVERPRDAVQVFSDGLRHLITSSWRALSRAHIKLAHYDPARRAPD